MLASGSAYSTANAAVNLPNGFSASTVAVGVSTVCAIAQSNLEWCWGDNMKDELGLGIGAGTTLDSPDTIGLGVASASTHNSTLAQLFGALPGGVISGGLQATSISSSMAVVCALGADTHVHCFGQAAVGTGTSGVSISNVVGYSSPTTPDGVGGVPTPTNIKLGSDNPAVTQIAVGGYHVCALTVSGGVRCWGSNTGTLSGWSTTSYTGQLGISTGYELGNQPSDFSSLADIAITAGITIKGALTPNQLAAGNFHTCAVASSGNTVKCWGLANYNGVSASVNLLTPTSAYSPAP
jgi:alpha-tubulin suppressor-like RCC1 family protein